MDVRDLLFIVLGLALLVGMTAPADGDVNRWIVPGQPLDGGIVRALAASDGHLYAGTWGDGVFALDPDEERWSPAGLPGRFVLALAANPQDPAVLYAGTSDGLYRTHDGGATWRPIGLDGPARAIAVDPTNPNRIVAGMDRWGIILSEDGGARWIGRNEGLPVETLVFSLAIDPRRPERLFAGTSRGIYRSENGGGRWEPTGTIPFRITSIVLDPTDPDVVFAAAYQDGVYRSLDGGLHWEQVLAERFRRWVYPLIHGLALDPNDSEMLYAATFGAGLLLTRDRGASWAVLPTENGFLYSMAADPNDGTLYVGSEGDGVYRLEPDLRWKRLVAGMQDAHVKTVAVDPIDPNVVYAATWGGGVYRSLDRAATWLPADERLPNLVVTAFAVHPKNPKRLYAGTDGGGIFRSEDRGRTWQPIKEGLWGGIYTALAIDPNDPDVVYAGSEALGVLVSRNGGDLWEKTGLTRGAIWSLLVHPKDPRILLAGTWGSTRFGDEEIGIFRSDDRGRTWELVIETAPVVALASDPHDPNTIYAGTFGAGVWRSRDAGKTWTPRTTGLGDANVWTVALDPSRRGRIYAGTWGGGVFRSDDGGDTWRRMNVGLRPRNVYSIAVDPQDSNVLYAGTSAGVMRYTIDEWEPKTATDPLTLRPGRWGGLKLETRLLPNYPNPFNPETWIPFSLGEVADVSIEIVDARGRLVRRLALGRLRPGWYVDRESAAYWDGRSATGEPVGSGLYFATIRAGRHSETRRLLVLK